MNGVDNAVRLEKGRLVVKVGFSVADVARDALKIAEPYPFLPLDLPFCSGEHRLTLSVRSDEDVGQLTGHILSVIKRSFNGRSCDQSFPKTRFDVLRQPFTS